jgi:hypothetical protein
MPKTLRLVVASALVCVFVVAGVQPATASFNGEPAHVRVVVTAKKHEQKDGLCKKASTVRRSVIEKYTKIYAQQFGKKEGKKRAARLPGRDICRFGLKHGKRPPYKRRAHYVAVLHRLKSPPVVAVLPQPTAPVVTSVQIPQPAPVPPSAPASGGGLPACASESGTNYSTGSGRLVNRMRAPDEFTQRKERLRGSVAANYGQDTGCACTFDVLHRLYER